MSVEFQRKDKYDIADLLEIMQILRAPGGCPWDAAQTHKSIKKDFIEETYEVIEAINKEDRELLLEELGDVLMQVVFHAEIEREKGSFDFSDVADGICKKLIERHPHVFGDITVNGTDEVLDNWDKIKRRSKKQDTYSSAMDAVPRELPALMRSTKIQKKAAMSGFDWSDAQGAFDKLNEEISELKEAVSSGSQEKIADELGDVLFSVVNVSRFLKQDAEEALSGATDKFVSRYKIVEEMAGSRGIDMKKASIEQLDELWDEAKNNSAR